MGKKNKKKNKGNSEMSLEEYYADLVLPDWLQDTLPAPEDASVIFYDEVDEVFRIRKHNKLTLPKPHETLNDAYKHAHKLGLDQNLAFDKSIDGKGGKWDGSSSFTFDADSRGMRQLLIAMTNSTRLALLKASYSHFLKLYRRYKKNPKNVAIAYRFLDTHPVFWTKRDNDRPYGWATDGLFTNHWFGISGSDKKPTYMLEAGAHVAPDYKYHYHDLRLDVYGKSWDEVVIKLAKKVDKFFSPDGNERENVEYEKSELELTLEARIKEYEEATKTDSTTEPSQTNES